MALADQEDIDLGNPNDQNQNINVENLANMIAGYQEDNKAIGCWKFKLTAKSWSQMFFLILVGLIILIFNVISQRTIEDVRDEINAVNMKIVEVQDILNSLNKTTEDVQQLVVNLTKLEDSITSTINTYSSEIEMINSSILSFQSQLLSTQLELTDILSPSGLILNTTINNVSDTLIPIIESSIIRSCLIRYTYNQSITGLQGHLDTLGATIDYDDGILNSNFSIKTNGNYLACIKMESYTSCGGGDPSYALTDSSFVTFVFQELRHGVNHNLLLTSDSVCKSVNILAGDRFGYSISNQGNCGNSITVSFKLEKRI
jgi:hypothetical protein